MQAEWATPRIARGSRPGLAATWIGAQRPGASLYRTPFIQVGTIEERYRLRIGVTRDLYYAFWTDTAKRFNVVDLLPVKPGDGVTAKLSLERGRWSISILDAATGRSAHVATPDETRQRLNVAAWIQEDVTDGRTGRVSPYPQLSSIHMRGLTINSARPRYADVYAEWMSENGTSLAPTPMANASFTLREVVMSAIGERYLQIADALDSAAARFIAQFERWTTLTPRSQITTDALAYVGALRNSAQALGGVRWPRSVQPLIMRVIIDARMLITQTRSVIHTPVRELGAWGAAWFHDTTAAGIAGRLTRRALHVPEFFLYSR
jgi:hypothetical protein